MSDVKSYLLGLSQGKRLQRQGKGVTFSFSRTWWVYRAKCQLMPIVELNGGPESDEYPLGTLWSNF